ncbi:hypothetical protein D3C85_1639090 [compost metagenome]
MALDTRYAAPPTAIRYAEPCFLMASIATGPRSDLPIIEIRPVFSSIMSVNLSMRVAVVGPAGPTTSSPTGSTGPT